LHFSTGADEAVAAKHHFECIAAEHGVLAKKYQVDNAGYLLNFSVFL
jgi:hypothetical protein